MANELPSVVQGANLKLTPKQLGFCHSYVECGNACEAYRQNYNAKNMKPTTIAVKACELLKNGKVAVTVNQLQMEIRQRHEVTVDSLTDEYEEARDLALNIEQPSAAISATTGKARLHGLDKQESVQVNVQQNTVKLTNLELARRLAGILQIGAMEAEAQSE